MKLTPDEYSKLLGFWPISGARFKVGGRTYRLGRSSQVTLQHLIAMRKATESEGWAVKSLKLVKEIERLNCSAMLSCVI
ncbi:MAG: hypothetical protein AAF497_14030, partial [Planctomycetota bacterium]